MKTYLIIYDGVIEVEHGFNDSIINECLSGSIDIIDVTNPKNIKAMNEFGDWSEINEVSWVLKASGWGIR